jgi:hypothetical protein
MKEGGWVKLHRRILINPAVMKDAEHLALWSYLLLSVVHESTDVFFGGKRIKLKPGQMTTGIRRIAHDLRISESKTQRMLKFFENETQIEQQMSTECRLITVKNWGEYQRHDTRSGTPVTRKRHASETRVETNKEGKNERTIPPSGEEAQPTPKEIAVQFFSSPEVQLQCAESIAARCSVPLDHILAEIRKFVGYWTERNKSGTRQRWELQSTFEVKRRIETWFRKSGQYAEKGAIQSL